MDRTQYIGLDAHARTCDLGCVTATGNKSGHWHVRTSIPDLVKVLEEIPRPRKLALEEGPMADWLARELRPHVEELVICDPRRNALIGKSREKTDALDAFTLADLYRGNYLRAVHHPESLEREVFKRHVAFYHDRVGQRVREANKTLAFLRRLGIVVLDRDLADRELRGIVLEQVPKNEVVRADVQMLLRSYDHAARQVLLARRALVRLAKTQEPIRRFVAIPGIKAGAVRIGVQVDVPKGEPDLAAIPIGVRLQPRGHFGFCRLVEGSQVARHELQFLLESAPNHRITLVEPKLHSLAAHDLFAHEVVDESLELGSSRRALLELCKGRSQSLDSSGVDHDLFGACRGPAAQDGVSEERGGPSRHKLR